MKRVHVPVGVADLDPSNGFHPDNLSNEVCCG